MNREIKFKAWHTLRNEMWDCDDLILARCYLAPSGVGFVRLTGDGSTELMKPLLPLAYTGLKDRNGKEIYEGDIVKIVSPSVNNKKRHPDYIGAVTWSELNLGYEVEIGSNDWMPLENRDEIIGNIYSNPELNNQTKIV